MENDGETEDDNFCECVETVVIGCGFAGLGAAQQFYNHDFNDFIVLEARDRVGGRVATSYELPAPSTSPATTSTSSKDERFSHRAIPIDLGAGWIHHIRHNPVYKTALRLGVPCEFNSYTHQFFYDARNGGGPIDQNMYQKFRKNIWKKFENELETKQNKMERDIKSYNGSRSSSSLPPLPSDFSLRQFANDYVEQNQTFFLSSPEHRAMFESVLHLAYVGEYAADLKYLSFLKFDDDIELDGSDAYLSLGPVTISADDYNEKVHHDDKSGTSSGDTHQKGNGGYNAIVEGIAKPFRQKIRLNCSVTCIDYAGGSTCDRNDGRALEGDNHQKNNILVTYRCTTTSLMKRIRARHVICTLPLGVLQQPFIKDIFRPPLPPEKVESIHKLGVGHLNKCVLYWQGMDDKDIFWPKKTEWLLRLIESPEGGEVHNNNAKRVNFVDFYNAYQFNGGLPLLVGYVAGDDAKEMEGFDDKDITQCALDCLRRMFPNVPDPTHSMVTRWSNDPHSQGAYSYLKVDSSNKDRKILAQPVAVQDNLKEQRTSSAQHAEVEPSSSSSILWFAGEATHTLYPATTHGAMFSGEDVALKILKLIKKS